MPIETICFGDTSIIWTSSAGHLGDLGGGTEEDVPFELELEVAKRRGLRRATGQDPIVGNVPSGLQLGVGLGDDVLLLLIGGEEDDLVGDLAVDRPCGTGSRGSRSR